MSSDEKKVIERTGRSDRRGYKGAREESSRKERSQFSEAVLGRSSREEFAVKVRGDLLQSTGHYGWFAGDRCCCSEIN